MSSSRSTIAYSVSYAIAQKILATNNSHASGGSAFRYALNAIRIDMPNAMPSHAWGSGKNRFEYGYDAATISATTDKAMVNLLRNSTSTKDSTSRPAASISASAGLTSPAASGRSLVRATCGS